MLQLLTKSETLNENGEMPFSLVNINGIPCWREARTGRTFPQVAGGSDESASDGDSSDGGDTEGGADDDDTESSDAEHLRLRVQALRKGEKSLKEHLKTQRRELDALKAKEQERADADKSELEKAQIKLAAAEKAHTESQDKLRRTLIAQAIERAAVKFNARDPEVIAKLVDMTELKLDDEGAPTNADELVKALLKEKTYLVNSEAPTTTNGSGVPPTPRSSGQPGQAEKVAGKQKLLAESGNYAEL